MIVIAGTVRLPEANRDQAMAAMRQMIEVSRAEDGCLDYSYAFDVLDPGLVRVFEVWRDQAAFDRHTTAPHLQDWRASWAELGIGERNLVAYQTDGSVAV